MKKLLCPAASIVLLLFCCVWLFPIYIIVVNSFKSREQMYLNTLASPSSLTLEYYRGAMERMDFGGAFANSLILTLGGVALIVLLSAMTGWMLARADGKFSRFLYTVMIVTMLIPFQTIMMPLMQEMNSLGRLLHIPIKDTLGGLIFMYLGFGAGMGVFLFYGFVKSAMPKSLEEAAVIDGCNAWQLFWRVVFPVMKPTVVTLVILDVIWIWNDYLLPSLTLTSARNRTIPIGTKMFFGQYTIEWNMAMAALTLTVIPVIIFYLCAQKYIVKGVAAGAVKG